MEKLKNQLQISVSNDGFVDEGEGVISFPNGLTITDDSVMRSGTRYDINSLDIVGYQGQLTGDHEDSLGKLIGKVSGVAKTGNRVVINKIKYAIKENPYARLAYNLLVGGFSNSFSIETIGPYPEDDRTYRNHELVGLSQVVVPNNYNARINQFNEIVHNSLERSQEDGLDVTGIEKKIYSSVELKSSEPVDGEDMTKSKEEVNDSKVEETPTEVKETEVKETEVVEKTEDVVHENNTEVNDDPAKEEVEEPKAEETEKEVEVKSEAIVRDVSGTNAPQPDGKGVNEEVVEETESEEAEPEVREELKEQVEETDSEEEAKNKTNKNEENLEMTKEEMQELIANSVAAALKPVQEELAATKETAQNALDAQAKEPEFEKVETKNDAKSSNSYDDLSAEELFSKQLNAAVAAERMGSVEGAKVLSEINARNLQALKEEKIVNAALTLEDLGNFVIAPELYRDIETARTDYTALLNATQWRETNALEFGWLTRTSDIDMKNVAIGANGDVPSPDVDENGVPTNNRLKPVSMPGYGAHFDRMEEMAAVTPISINVIKFAAADILADVAEGYRNDYDRKRAQLVVARLQQAAATLVNGEDRIGDYDMESGLSGWSLAVANAGDATTVGTLVFNNRTLSKLKSMAIESQNSAVLTELGTGNILGTPFVVVPNDLMPTLGTDEVRTFEVAGADVDITSAVFYGDLRSFTGRTSGGLKYDVDGSASYEIFDDAGNRHVFSAYQRNEIVLRGSFFRGGVVKDPSVVSAIAAASATVS